MAQCGSCDSWVYTSDAPSTPLKDADGATFKCKICTTLHTIQANITLHEKRIKGDLQLEIDSLKIQLREMEAHNNAEREKLMQVIQTESALREELASEVKALQGQIEVSGESTGNVIETPLRPCNMQAIAPTPGNLNSGLECPPTPEKNGQVSESSKSTGPRTTRTPWSNAAETKQRLTTAGGPVEGCSPPEGANNTTHNRPVSSGGHQLQQQHQGPSRRYCVILGDSNAHRLKKTAYQTVKDRRVRITTRSGAKVEETLCRAEEEIARANSTSTTLQLVLHVGTTDIIQKEDTTKLADSLHQKLASWSENAPQHSYYVCAVPEINTRGTEIKQECCEWNDKVASICNTLGPAVEFLQLARSSTQGNMDDIHYDHHMADDIGRQLAQKVTAFLRPKTRPTENRGHQKKTPLPHHNAMQQFLQVMTTALGQLANSSQRW